MEQYVGVYFWWLEWATLLAIKGGLILSPKEILSLPLWSLCNPAISHIHIHIQVSMSVCIYMCVCVCVCMCVALCACMHAHAGVCVCACACACCSCMHACMPSHAHIPMSVQCSTVWIGLYPTPSLTLPPVSSKFRQLNTVDVNIVIPCNVSVSFI